MLKRSLAVLLTVVMVLSFSSMVALAETKDAEAIKGTPVIDGVMDDIWQQATEYDLANKIPETGDPADVADAKFRAMWDEDKLYVWAEIKDDNMWAAHEENLMYLEDSFVVFMEEDNGKDGNANEAGYTTSDKDFTITCDGELDTYYDEDDTHWEAKAIKTEGEGYVIEGAITFASIKGAEGTTVGFDVSINDATYMESLETGGKDGGAFWNDTTGDAWKNTSLLGNLKFVATPAPSDNENNEETPDESSDESSDLPDTGSDATLLYTVAIVALSVGLFTIVRKKATAK